MNRRSFIGLVLGAAAAVTFKAAKTVDQDLDLLQAWYKEKESLGAQLSYVTRRSYLAPAYAQIYNTSPLITGLLTEGEEDDALVTIKYQHQEDQAPA